MSKTKLRWMRRFAKTKNFILMTDTEAVMFIKSLDLDDINDLMLIGSYRAELESFRNSLDQLIKDFDRDMGQFVPKKAMPKKSKKGKKIPVKQL